MATLAAVKAFGAIDVRNRDDDDLELHVDRPRSRGLDCSFATRLSTAHVELLRFVYVFAVICKDSAMPKTKDKSQDPPNSADADVLLCAQPAPVPIVLPNGLSPTRESAIRIGAKKWVNGTILHYHFLDRSTAPNWTWTETQKDVVRWAFGIWKQLGIGLSFVEVGDVTEAEIRIGCLRDNRSWSYVGTDNLTNRDLGRTMNFGWDLTTTWGKATAIHEIGHAIGLSHEHQNPKAGIVWNEQQVYEYFSGQPNNWDHSTIYNNILRKLDVSEVEGSNWNPRSIMEYPFRPGLIISPKPYDTKGIGENTTLSQADIEWGRIMCSSRRLRANLRSARSENPTVGWLFSR
jgi:hypothetical protein